MERVLGVRDLVGVVVLSVVSDVLGTALRDSRTWIAYATGDHGD